MSETTEHGGGKEATLAELLNILVLARRPHGYVLVRTAETDALVEKLLAPTPPTRGDQAEVARLREAALRDADEISARIHKGGYRGNLFDTERLRNHVRKLASALSPTSSAEPQAGAPVGELREALTWYADQGEKCRRVTSEGEAARQALDADGGKRALAALSAEPAFICAARLQTLPEPTDCDWPVCGCDPAANKVVAALEEGGALAVAPVEMLRAALDQAVSFIRRTLTRDRQVDAIIVAGERALAAAPVTGDRETAGVERI